MSSRWNMGEACDDRLRRISCFGIGGDAVVAGGRGVELPNRNRWQLGVFAACGSGATQSGSGGDVALATGEGFNINPGSA